MIFESGKNMICYPQVLLIFHKNSNQSQSRDTILCDSKSNFPPPPTQFQTKSIFTIDWIPVVFSQRENLPPDCPTLTKQVISDAQTNHKNVHSVKSLWTNDSEFFHSPLPLPRPKISPPSLRLFTIARSCQGSAASFLIKFG